MNEKTTQMIQGMVQQIQEQLLQVESQIQEFERMIFNLEEYTKTDSDSEMLVPIANGIFVKAKSLDTQKFTINVGSETLVEKTLPEAKEMLSKQIANLQTYRDELIQELEKTNVKI